MGLTDRGIVSIVQAVIYLPIAILAICLTFKHGFRRDLGWIYLAIFSTVRIIGGAMLAVEQTESKPSSGLVTAALILQGIGLAPLFLATAGFLGIVAQHAKRVLITPLVKKLMHLPILVAAILSIVGTTDQESSNPSTQKDGTTFKKAAALLFAGTYVVFVLQHGYYWIHRNEILTQRRKLLLGISCALPWLLLRIIYSITGVFTTSHLFSPLTGSLALYVVLAVLPEFFAALTYTCFGMFLPLGLDREEETSGADASSLDDLQKSGSGFSGRRNGRSMA